MNKGSWIKYYFEKKWFKLCATQWEHRSRRRKQITCDLIRLAGGLECVARLKKFSCSPLQGPIMTKCRSLTSHIQDKFSFIIFQSKPSKTINTQALTLFEQVISIAKASLTVVIFTKSILNAFDIKPANTSMNSKCVKPNGFNFSF